MPLYVFIDDATGISWEEVCTIAAMERKCSEPNIRQVIHAPAIVSGVQGITHKVSAGMNEVLSKAAEAHPSSPLADSHLRRSNKEVKTREVAKKYNK